MVQEQANQTIILPLKTKYLNNNILCFIFWITFYYILLENKKNTLENMYSEFYITSNPIFIRINKCFNIF